MFWLFGPEAGGSQLPDQGPNPYTLHWKAKKSQPLDHQGSLDESKCFMAALWHTPISSFTNLALWGHY